MSFDASTVTVRRTVIHREAMSHSAGRGLLLVSLLMCTRVGPVFAQAAGDQHSVRLQGAVDASIKPGDDFFAYANGAWLKATELPPGKDRWGARNELENLSRQRVTLLIDAARSAPVGSTARKVADFRAAYLNQAAIESRGLTAIRALLDSIDHLRDKAALAHLLGSLVPADVDPLGFGVFESSHVVGFSVEQSVHGEPNTVAFLVQGGLALPSRDDYLSDDPRRQALRATYAAYIARILSLAGAEHADERARRVLALETALARTHATLEASAADHNADSVWRRDQFSTRAPGMDWAAFLAGAGLDRQTEIGVWQPVALRGLASQVESEPLVVWKDYLRFHALHRYADVLPSAFAEQATAMRRAMSPDARPSREDRALAATQSAMSDAIGRMYAERYFPADEKARIERISDNVRAALIRRVEAASWMSPATQATALEKLRTLYVGIGYPEQWEDYSSLRVDAMDASGDLRRVADRAVTIARGRLGQPVDLKYWFMAPHTVGALLVFQQNSYVMSAALLEPPKFDRMASDAAAYGSVGALLGHDFTHYIDVLGADYDTQHRLKHWWTPEDMQHFQALGHPLTTQFAQYQPFPGVAVDGKLTLNENIADLGGLAAAFDAYRETLGARARDTAWVHQQDREFFIAFAQTMRRRISDAAMRTVVATNDHAPENYRVDTVRNLDAWYDAFDVRPGDRLYLEPAARVRVW